MDYDFSKLKLGDEIKKEDFGELGKVTEGRLRLMKITYTFQDADTTTFSLGLSHKDYEECEDYE